MKTYVLDTSVIVKWFNQEKEEHIEDASQIYQQLIDGKINIFIPDFLILELINVLQVGKKVSLDEIKNAINIIFKLPIVIKDISESLLIKTTEIAEKYNITAYDGLFLAMAYLEDCQLISDDKKAHGRIRDDRVLMLADY